MHCEMTDCYFNIYFIKIQLKIENLKIVFLGARVWAPKPVHQAPKWSEYITGQIQKFKNT